MEGNYPLNLSQRGFSREGGMRVPSRERQVNTPEIRKKASGTIGSKTTLSVSGQNFFNSSQQFEGTSSSTDDLSLATLNIAVDETAFISTAKVDILQLQEEINKMDNDGRIRNTNTANILKYKTWFDVPALIFCIGKIILMPWPNSCPKSPILMSKILSTKDFNMLPLLTLMTF